LMPIAVPMPIILSVSLAWESCVIRGLPPVVGQDDVASWMPITIPMSIVLSVAPAWESWVIRGSPLVVSLIYVSSIMSFAETLKSCHCYLQQQRNIWVNCHSHKQCLYFPLNCLMIMLVACKE
jgi:hypothetical protein